MTIAAGFVERSGRHLYDALALFEPGGGTHIYRKRNLVFWERFRFYPGKDPLVVPTRFGRVGLAICADMIYKRVWADYRGRIDLADRRLGLARFRRPQDRAQALAVRPRRAALGGDPALGRGRSRHSCRLRQPVRRDPDDDPDPPDPDHRPIRRPEQHHRRPPRPPPCRRVTGDQLLISEITLHPQPRTTHGVPFYVRLGPRGILFRARHAPDRRASAPAVYGRRAGRVTYRGRRQDAPTVGPARTGDPAGQKGSSGLAHVPIRGQQSLSDTGRTDPPWPLFDEASMCGIAGAFDLTGTREFSRSGSRR